MENHNGISGAPGHNQQQTGGNTDTGSHNNVYPPIPLQQDASGYSNHHNLEGLRERMQRDSYRYHPAAGWHRAGGKNNVPQMNHSINHNQQPAHGTASGTRWDLRSKDTYRWDFNEYDKLDRNKGNRRNRGLVVFCVSLVGVLIVSLFVLTGYTILLDAQIPPVPFSAGDEDNLSGGDYDAVIEPGPSLELSAKPQEGAQERPAAHSGKLTIPEIAKKVSPAVVGVSTFAEGGRFYEPLSVGSGIIMSEDGYVITNAHVVQGGINFKVQLHDATPYEAELIGHDMSTDLAILKIDMTGLVPAEFGDSNETEVGETVVAIGNPSGIELAGSVTSGIVSAINRTIIHEPYQFNYLQTDAAINPGNSGGALVNEYGQVIGINSAKIIAAGYEGIGFAIPITDAKPILDDIIQNGRVTGRVMLGITCEVVTEADSLRFDVPMGLEIVDISERSDLMGKGVQKGDILMEIDGVRVYTVTDIQTILRNHSVNDEVTLKFYRRLSSVQNVEFEVTIQLIEN